LAPIIFYNLFQTVLCWQKYVTSLWLNKQIFPFQFFSVTNQSDRATKHIIEQIGNFLKQQNLNQGKRTMKTMPLLAFLPQEMIPVMMVFGGLLLVFGLRGLAMSLFSLCGILIVAPIILEPFLNMLPQWALYLFIGFFFFSVLGILLSMLIGNRAYQHMIGILAADIVRFLFLAPFRIIRSMFRMFRS
jgi:hypothetical protein